MPDIQMCDGKADYDDDIKLRQVRFRCYRHIAASNEHWQSYGPPAPDFKPESGCSNFMEAK